MAELDIPDNVYSYWLVSYFRGHLQCIKYDNLTSAFPKISAGIIQGSGIGPASFVVNAGDLKVVTLGNSLCKYADDTYLIIPSYQFCLLKLNQFINLDDLGVTIDH